MGFEQYKDMWVFTECFGEAPKDAELELLGQSRKLAEGLEQQLCAVVIGKEVKNTVQTTGTYGANKIHVVQGNGYDHYSTDGHGYVFLELCKKYDLNTILVGATVSGRSLGSKLAVSLHIGLTADCTTLSAEDTGNVTWERPAFGGSPHAQILYGEIRS